MEVKLEELIKLAEQKRWSLKDMATKMDLDYSYLYRVINGQRTAGRKFFSGLMLMCMDEGLDFQQFVYFKREK